jgi:superfamily II DNA or RNA helicase
MDKFYYQNIAAKKVLENLYSGKFIASGLFAVPNSGKTTISHQILNSYLEKNPNAKVVVLTHGQNLLKLQYLKELENPNIHIHFTFGDFESKTQVLVGIPQSLNKLNVKKVDLLIVDEAHQFYQARTVQDFITQYKIKDIILLTGSPSQFVLHNQTSATKYGTHFISGEELQGLGIFSKVDMDIITTSSSSVVEQIKLAFKKLDEKGANRSKVMIAVKSIQDANLARTYLAASGRKVSLSTSENDSENIEIQKFKDGLTNTLVVVNRGILGFSDKNITALIDLRESKDLECSFQLLARIIRKHEKNIEKTYIRLTRNNNEGVVFLNKLLALFEKDIYNSYNGSNLEVEIL